MQSLKWRLSFQTKQSVRPAKKLWVEYLSLVSKDKIYYKQHLTTIVNIDNAGGSLE